MKDNNMAQLNPRGAKFASACTKTRLSLAKLADRAQDDLAAVPPHELGAIGDTLLRMMSDMQRLIDAVVNQVSAGQCTLGVVKPGQEKRRTKK